METSRTSSRRQLQLSLLDLLVAISALAFLMAATKLSPEAAAIAFVATSILSLLLIALPFVVPRHVFMRPLLRYVRPLFISLVLFASSLGPACWLMTSPSFAGVRTPAVRRAFFRTYGPIGISYAYAPEPLHMIAVGYLRWWVPDDELIGGHGWGIRITIDGNMSVIGIETR